MNVTKIRISYDSFIFLSTYQIIIVFTSYVKEVKNRVGESGSQYQPLNLLDSIKDVPIFD